MTLDKVFLSELGRVTYHFQHLEIAFVFLTTSLINEDQKIGQICLSKQSFKQLCTKMENLFRYKIDDEASIENLADMVKRARKLEVKRNTLIHSFYLSDKLEAEGNITRAKFLINRKRFRTDFQDVTAEDIREVSDHLASLFNEFLEFLSEVHRTGLVRLPWLEK